mgnify:CR=1 FL=1
MAQEVLLVEVVLRCRSHDFWPGEPVCLPVETAIDHPLQDLRPFRFQLLLELTIILLLDVAATSIFEIFEEFGTESPDRIGRETRFIDISTDSLSFVNASIALEGYLGFIPPRWDQLSLAELEELKHVAHV